MVTTVFRPRAVLFVTLVLGVYASELFALHRLGLQAAALPALRWAPVVDLLLVPLLLYGACFGWQRLLRPTGRLPILLLVAGVLMLRFALPPPVRLPGPWLEGLALAVEAFAVTRLLAGVNRIRGAFRVHRERGEGVYESILFALREVVPPAAADYLALEASVLVTLLGYRRVRAAEAVGVPFSYVRRGAVGAVYAALIVMVVAETAGGHIILTRWLAPRWHGWIWVLTVLGLYSLLWLVADLLAMTARPHRISGGHLYLRLGFRRWLRVPLAGVVSADRYKPPVPRFTPGDRIRLARLRIPTLCPPATDANIRLTFARPATLTGPFGRPQQITEVAIAVDDP